MTITMHMCNITKGDTVTKRTSFKITIQGQSDKLDYLSMGALMRYSYLVEDSSEERILEG